MGGGLWQRRLRAALVVSEIAVTLVLTIAAALLLQSFSRLQRVARGSTRVMRWRRTSRRRPSDTPATTPGPTP